MSNQLIEELLAQNKALQQALKASESMRKSEEMRHKKAERAMGEEIQRNSKKHLKRRKSIQLIARTSISVHR